MCWASFIAGPHLNAILHRFHAIVAELSDLTPIPVNPKLWIAPHFDAKAAE